jgi:predicted 3-demethylubiquinone-9 3-methyltransferase (glyoxalase superfamily)
LALNGGPIFKFNEAISFQIYCETQEQVDYYWEKLSEGGDKNAQQCGWLKDKFGVSWQVVPTVLITMLQDKDSNKTERVMKAMLQMHKLDINALTKAYREE